MNIKERIKETEDRMKKVAAEYNALNDKQQELIKEAMRLEGEMRVLKELDKE